MILSRNKTNTEIDEFKKKFAGQKLDYVLRTSNDKILTCRTKDKKIIAWLNDIGFNES